MIIYISDSINNKRNGGSSTSGYEFFQFLRIKYPNVILITNDKLKLSSKEVFYGYKLHDAGNIYTIKRDSSMRDFSFRSLLRSVFYSLNDFLKIGKIDVDRFYKKGEQNIIYVNSWSPIFTDKHLLNYKKFKKVCVVRGAPESFIWQSFEENKDEAVLNAARYLENFDQLIFVSENGKIAWSSILNRKINSYYLPNSINEKEVERIKTEDVSLVKTKLRLSDSDLNVIVVGSVQKRKAQDILLKVVEKVAKHIPNIKFHIIGVISKTWGGDIIYKKIQQSQYKNYFIFHGHSEDVLKFMYSGDIMLFTSYAEAFPRTVAEYMAMEKPIIAANVSGVSEMIKHCENGFLFNPFKPHEAGSLLLELYKDHSLRNTFSKKAYQYYQEKFSKRVHIKSALNIFDKIESK